MAQLDDLGTSWLAGGNNPKKPRQQEPKALSFAEKEAHERQVEAVWGRPQQHPQDPPTRTPRKGRK